MRCGSRFRGGYRIGLITTLSCVKAGWARFACYYCLAALTTPTSRRGDSGMDYARDRRFVAYLWCADLAREVRCERAGSNDIDAMEKRRSRRSRLDSPRPDHYVAPHSWVCAQASPSRSHAGAGSDTIRASIYPSLPQCTNHLSLFGAQTLPRSLDPTRKQKEGKALTENGSARVYVHARLQPQGGVHVVIRFDSMGCDDRIRCVK